MSKFNSIVIKLWLTIILIVTTVLIILSIALVSFFNSYMISETGKTLYQDATKIEEVLMSHHRQSDAIDYAKELVENPAGLIIVKNKGELNQATENELKQVMIDEIRNNKDYEAVFNNDKHVTKTISVHYLGDVHQYILLGYPSQAFNENGAIILYQDINSISDTVRYISLIILIVAFLMLILTTIFAFFLSTRITKPLLLLKQAAFDVARGEKTAKIETFSRDEIGELAIAFKKMESDISDNMNYIRSERNIRDKLIDAMADGVLSYNLDIDAQLSNPAAKQFLEQIDQNQKQTIIETFEQVMHTLTNAIIEIESNNKHYVLIFSPINNSGLNGSTGAVALIRDMTEERKNDEMKKRFIADVSHELRTPIQMLQGYTEALLDGIAETEAERREMLNIILDESMRLNRMVNELLNVARYDAGDISVNKEPVNLEKLFSKIKMNFSQSILENEVQFNVEVPSHLTVNIDYDKFIQVFTNIIDNAIRYTHKGDTISLKAIERTDDVVFQISDTGVGIMAHHLEHLFDRFYKVDSARTRGKNGTGLGLFIVKAIIEAHQGTIQVTSEVNRGTTFIISIPKY